MRLALLSLALGACWATPDRPSCALAHAIEELQTDQIEGNPWLSNDRLDIVFLGQDLSVSRYRLFHAERSSPAEKFANIVQLDLPASEEPHLDMFDPWLSPDKRLLRFVVGDGNTGGAILEATRDEAMPGRYNTLGAGRVFTNVGVYPGANFTSILHPTFTDDDLEMVFVHPPGTTSEAGIVAVRRDSTDADFHVPEVELGLSTTMTTSPMILGDGQTLVYHVTDGGLGRIYRAEREGNDFVHGALVPELLDQSTEDDSDPYLAPDRETWLFARDTFGIPPTNADVWAYCE